jgi:hypothetical protein
MLASEKKRVIWSLAIGAFCTSTILVWEHQRESTADRDLFTLIERCKDEARSGISVEPRVGSLLHSNKAIQDKPATFEFPPNDCEPKDIEADERAANDRGIHFFSFSRPEQQQIFDFVLHGKDRSIWRLPIVMFSLFGLPFLWYFLLDRLRELSAAISGRDRNTEAASQKPWL